jgi:orotate phosphoribosyltransferase
VLVVDDSVLTGRQLETARRRLASASLPHDLRYAAVYVHPGKEHLVDFSHQALPYPRMFEWNLMHHPMLEKACVDIDGVLCRDPTEAENDDGDGYSKFLETVTPRVRPAFPIGTLVTCRLEKYRSATEDWLARNMIRYGNLVMMHYSSKAERIAANRHAAFKAEAYVAARAMIFIESSVRQAQEIADLTARPVVSTDRMQLCTPGIRTKTDIVNGLRKAGSLSGRIRWVRTNRGSILSWVRRRRAARRKL